MKNISMGIVLKEAIKQAIHEDDIRVTTAKLGRVEDIVGYSW